MPAACLDENQTRTVTPDREVDSLCPCCGVGCQVSHKVNDERIIHAEGRDGPANHNRLCVKGRFGFDHIHHRHVHGTDNARCLIALALATGQIGGKGTGQHPLRGRNVQGASDAGLIPMLCPDHSPVEKAEVREMFKAFSGRPLDPANGLTMRAIHAGGIRGIYAEGENPAMSDPDLNHARGALARLDHPVVQDLFQTETAFHADVVRPASAFAERTGSFTSTDRHPGSCTASAWSPATGCGSRRGAAPSRGRCARTATCRRA